MGREESATLNVTEVTLGKPHNVILFNDEDHTKHEVLVQIMKALSCGTQRAYQIMIEAHYHGRSIVWTGNLERCEHIASILEEIRLGIKVEPSP